MALAWAIDRSAARAGGALGLRSAGQHAALAQLRRLHARPLEGSGARLPLRPREGASASSTRPAGGSAPTACAATDGVRASFELAYAGRLDREAGGHADSRLGARRRHRDRRARLRQRQADQPRVQHGRQEAHARLRHRDLVDRRRSRRPSSCSRCSRRTRSASGTTRASPTRDYERLFKRETRATDEAARIEDIHTLQRIATARPALHRAVRARRPRRGQHAHLAELDDAALAGRPADHVVRLRARSSR